MRRSLTLCFHSALHHGSGYGLVGIIDRTVLRDSSGMPYLAASSIKGRLRHASLRVLSSSGHPACEYGDQDSVCSGSIACGLCTLFGSRLRQAAVLVCDAYPDADTARILAIIQEASKGQFPPRDSSVRMGVAVDRYRRVVQPQLLFSTETLPSGLCFQSEILGDLDVSQESLLRKACHVLTHFGADAARGLGRCHYVLGPAKEGMP